MIVAAGSFAAPRRLALEEVDSTNSIAMAAARAGDPGPLWVTAQRQTSGRGRRGRAWVSKHGNLYSSLLLIDPAPLAALGQLPLVIAVGLANAIAGLSGIEPDAVRIKWPNDILLHGGKCTGILIESERLPDGRQAVVIGAGTNVLAAPDDQPYSISTLAAAGFRGPVEDVFTAAAKSVDQALHVWRSGANFAEIRALWLARAAGLGQGIRVNLPDRSVDGVFRELDADGRLVLQLPGGRVEHYSAGDVFLLGQQTGNAVSHKA